MIMEVVVLICTGFVYFALPLFLGWLVIRRTDISPLLRKLDEIDGKVSRLEVALGEFTSKAKGP